MKLWATVILATIGLTGCASQPMGGSRLPASNDSTPNYFAECQVSLQSEDAGSIPLFTAKDSTVTRGNGGIRQNCMYSSKDGKIRLSPFVISSDAGMLVYLYQGNVQFAMSAGRALGSNKMELSGFGIAPDGKKYQFDCRMQYVDAMKLPQTFSCPAGSDNPTNP